MSSYVSDEYLCVLVGESGLDTLVRQQIGPVIARNTYYTGQRVFSPDGTKLARYDLENHLLLYDFDRATGQLSNLQ